MTKNTRTLVLVGLGVGAFLLWQRSSAPAAVVPQGQPMPPAPLPAAGQAAGAVTGVVGTAIDSAVTGLTTAIGSLFGNKAIGTSTGPTPTGSYHGRAVARAVRTYY